MPETISQFTGDAGPNTFSIVVPSGGTHASKIDETIAAKNESDYIQDGVAGKIERFTKEVNAAPDTGQYTRIDLYAHLRAQDAVFNVGLKITLFDSAGQVAQKAFDLNGDNGARTVIFRFDGLTLTKQQYDDLEPQFETIIASGEPPPIEV